MLVPESAVLTQSTTAQSTPSQIRRANLMPVIRVAAGNALEMYDFQIFGYYAAAIAATFFPSGNRIRIADAVARHFRRGLPDAAARARSSWALTSTITDAARACCSRLTLMGFGTLAVACLPGYAVIGLAAPLLVLVGRLVQGFSAGVELGGVSVYLSEIAPPDAKAST